MPKHVVHRRNEEPPLCHEHHRNPTFCTVICVGCSESFCEEHGRIHEQIEALKEQAKDVA